MAWNTEGVKTNPLASEVLADTGALAASAKTFTLIIWEDTGGGEIEIAHRNALNADDVNVQRIALTGTTIIYPLPVTLLLNQRIIVRMRVALTGHIQASLFA